MGRQGLQKCYNGTQHILSRICCSSLSHFYRSLHIFSGSSVFKMSYFSASSQHFFQFSIAMFFHGILNSCLLHEFILICRDDWHCSRTMSSHSLIFSTIQGAWLHWMWLAPVWTWYGHACVNCSPAYTSAARFWSITLLFSFLVSHLFFCGI